MLTKMRQRMAAEEGFTLIELLVVIVIIGILLAIAIPSYLGFRGRAEKSAAQANVRSIVPSIEAYYSDNDDYDGMTVANLKSTYDQSIDASNYKTSETDTSYCVQSTKGAYIASKNGPSAAIVVAKTSTDVC